MQKNIFIFFWSLLISLILTFKGHAESQGSLIERSEVKAFIQDMVRKHHFQEKQLQTWLSQATIQTSILSAIAKPAEKLPWDQYQAIFLNSKRIEDGVTFWKENKTALQKAESEFGVPAEIIIAIIGVETSYGKSIGKYNVLDALVTLSFDYPPRSKFYLSELEEFLLLAREEKWDPAQIKGSYAGAMGIPQFIASSYRHYAIDFNGNGKRNLLNNVDDAIGSVANYFKIHGWQKNACIINPAKVTGNKFKNLIASQANPLPSHSLTKMASLGVQGIGKDFHSKHQDEAFALISFEGKSTEYWLGGKNFYVITRYNRSNYYAMAVYLLSQKIKDAYILGT